MIVVLVPKIRQALPLFPQWYFARTLSDRFRILESRFFLLNNLAQRRAPVDSVEAGVDVSVQEIIVFCQKGTLAQWAVYKVVALCLVIVCFVDGVTGWLTAFGWCYSGFCV